MKVILLLISIIVLVAPQGYDTTSTYTCLQENAAGRCTQWQQTMYTESTVKCFPGKAQVMTPEGLKSMEQIKQGDKVLGMKNGE